MSYVLQIWNPAHATTRPTRVEQAVALVTSLRQERPGTNPKFVALAQKLTEKYPDLADVLAQEDEDAECAWSDGPIDGKTESAVFNLGLNVALLEKVRPFVIRHAIALGLSVLDEQAGQAWLADGGMLRMPRLVPPPVEKAAEEEPPNARELADIVFERMRQVLDAEGYTGNRSETTFVRNHAAGWHELSIGITDFWPTSVMFCVYAGSRFHAVAELNHAVANPELLPENVARQVTVGFPQSSWMDEKKLPFLGVNESYDVRYRANLEPALAHLVMKLKTRVLPLLEQCETLDGIARIVFQEPVSRSDYGWNSGGATAILVAYLTNRPDLDAICEALLKRHAKNKLPSYLQATQRCVDYVRSHPR